MIAYLRGHVEHLFEHSVLIDVNGVGYQVFCSTKSLQQLGYKGAPVALWIETIIRPETLQLFGFLSFEEQEWFRLLLTVQGVGTRMALGLLSVFKLDVLANAILSQDKTLLTRAEGIGPKLAARLITELKEKVQKIAPTPAVPAALEASYSPLTVWAEALSALCNLGYGKFEAQEALDHIRKISGQEENLSLDQIIRQGLNKLSWKTAS